MELATSRPAPRAPAVWYAQWLVPLGAAVGTAVAGAAGPADSRIFVVAAGTVATAATARSVALSLLSRRQRQALSDAEANQEAERYEIGRLSAEIRQHSEQQRQILARLGREWMPAAVAQLRQGDMIDDILASLPADAPETEPFTPEIRAVLRAALRAVEEEFDRGTSAEQSVVNIGSRMQVHTNKLLGQLHEMQKAHGGLTLVARGLMELDQELGPANLLAASIVILGGSDRPSRQWQDPQPLRSVVRSGQGQIKNFRRVDVRRLPDLAVDGALVEHLAIMLAHLLDNATRYSPPTQRVVVSGTEVPNGVALEITDRGKGMAEEKKLEAQKSLDGVVVGAGPGGTTEDAHLGLRVVGILARRYGISVAFDESPWQGTSVVLVVPPKYFSPVAAEPRPVRDSEPEQVVISARGAGAGSGNDTAPATTAGGLPRRRSSRRSTDDMGTGEPADATAATAGSAVPPVESFDGLAAFSSSTRETTTDVPRPTAEERTSDSESS